MQNEETNLALLPESAFQTEAEAVLPARPPLPDTGETVTAARRCPPESAEIKEIARRGWELYEQKIRAQVEPQHIGKFMSIDVDTGEYAISDDSISAAMQLITHNPAVRSFGVRIGSKAMFRI